MGKDTGDKATEWSVSLQGVVLGSEVDYTWARARQHQAHRFQSYGIEPGQHVENL